MNWYNESEKYVDVRRFWKDICSYLNQKALLRLKLFTTVKPFVKNTSEEFIKCRLDNFSMIFILNYVNFSICENK